MDDGVIVAADGVSAEYALINNSASGNIISCELLLNGEVIFASDKLEPGEALQPFKLSVNLEAGAYEAALSIITYSADGGVSSRMSVPVEVTVGE